MTMQAIVFTTNTGSTERYAKLLAHETGLPAYTLEEAKENVTPGTDIIYMGWIMAGNVKGYATAAKRYKVRAVCAVGMGRTGSQLDDVRDKAHIPVEIPLFTLQGNFAIKKLHGFYRLMMEVMVKTVGKKLASKENRTPEEDEIVEMMLHGGDWIKAEYLKAVLEWYQKERE